MADLIRRREMEPLTRWDPFGLMEAITRWDPFRELERAYAPVVGRVLAPDFELRESKDAFVLRADVPGMKQDDIDISVVGNRVTVSGKREEEKREEGERYHVLERSYGTFTRSFTLPETCDFENITADLKEGVLSLTIPKKAEAQPKRIPLKAAPEAKGAKA